MSKEVWALTIRTSLPDVARSEDDLKTTNLFFQSFEKAKEALREKLKEFAFSQNEMFDGEGGLVWLDCYGADNLENSDEEYDSDDEEESDEDESDEEDEQWLTLSILEELEKALLHIFEGKDEQLSMKEMECCHDGMIALDVENDRVKLYGYDDGPYNGYDPNISTNMFDMTEEKNYYLYIDDMFGQHISSELYIDLEKTTVE